MEHSLETDNRINIYYIYQRCISFCYGVLCQVRVWLIVQNYSVRKQLIIFVRRQLVLIATNKDEPHWHGYIYTVLLFLTIIVRDFCAQHKDHMMAKMGIRMRSAFALHALRKVSSKHLYAFISANTNFCSRSCCLPTLVVDSVQAISRI